MHRIPLAPSAAGEMKPARNIHDWNSMSFFSGSSPAHLDVASQK